MLAIVGNTSFALLLFIPTATTVLMSQCFLLSVLAIISAKVREQQHKYLNITISFAYPACRHMSLALELKQYATLKSASPIFL